MSEPRAPRDPGPVSLRSVALPVEHGGWAHGLSPWHRPARPQVVGSAETGFGLLTVVLLALGYRLWV